MLVTGATGFLGRRTALRLHAAGAEVTAVGRNATIGAELGRAGLHFVAVDLADAEAMGAACAGQARVIHCGALSTPWGRRADFEAANIRGTENVIQGCLRHGVHRLVHVSTPSLYMDTGDRLDLREDARLPARAINHYAATKRIAEERIDAAFAAGLPVVTIRPQGIFGPGDQAIFPRLIRVAERGFLPKFGDRDPLIDVTYVDNVVDALVAAAEAPTRVLGRKFNITNGEPRPTYELLARILDRLGVKYRVRRIPERRALWAAGTLETVYRALALSREPVLTRYSVYALARSRTLDISAARSELGYAPRVSIDEGVERFANWWLASRRSTA